MNKITIIGGGNLGTAIAKGLVNKSFCTGENITITRRNVEAIKHLEDQKITINSNNVDAINDATWIILAVKPYQIESIAAELKPFLNPLKHKLISVITGIWISDLQNLFGSDFTIVRAMPNTAIAIGESMTCLAFNKESVEDKKYIVNLFNHLGRTQVIDENLMDAATVLGACGTAFAMRFIRANIQGGIEIGFSAEVATAIAAQTIKGAADLLLINKTHPEHEIDKVTTPQGCTIAGLNEMEHQGFSSSLIKGISASFRKIKG